MDKIFTEPKNLADFLKVRISFINEILINHPEPNITYKDDGSPVTLLDIAFSEYIEDLFVQHFPLVTFYSEEKFSEWSFPLLALDPLDGTREYIEKNPEWAMSLGLFSSKKFEGEGWIYNPQKQELFDRGEFREFKIKDKYIGEISRTEWKKGLFKHLQGSHLELKPVGSIAYKLGRLSHHQCDFVVSMRPKNIWDIAGGTLLCHQAGIKLYERGVEVTEVKPLYHPPLIWCHPSLFSELSKVFV